MKRVTIALAVAMLGGIVATPAPARADATWPLNCVLGHGTPALTTAYVDDEGRLVVNPEGAPDDVGALVDWAPGRLLDAYSCLLAPLPLDPVWCTYEALLAADPASYAYPNPNGPGYVVDIPRIESDARNVLDCHLAT